MSLSQIQGSFRERFATVSKDKLFLYITIAIAFLFCLWGVYPWVAHRSYLSLKVPSLHTSNNFLAPPQPIEQQHLFGIYVQDYAHLPITALPITLQGTMINTDDKKLSSAIISVNGNNAKLYHVNDSLPVGAKLIAIHNTYCVLDHGGRLEKLVLPRSTLQNDPVQTSLTANSGLKVLS